MKERGHVAVDGFFRISPFEHEGAGFCKQLHELLPFVGRGGKEFVAASFSGLKDKVEMDEFVHDEVFHSLVTLAVPDEVIVALVAFGNFQFCRCGDSGVWGDLDGFLSFGFKC